MPPRLTTACRAVAEDECACAECHDRKQQRERFSPSCSATHVYDFK